MLSVSEVAAFHILVKTANFYWNTFL